MTPRIFHLVVPESWRQADARADWQPSSLHTEGFVHMSFAAQLRDTTRIHFADHAEVWLFEVDVPSILADLRIETSRDAQPFPHLYRALRRDEILGWWRLDRDPRGDWRLPELGERADDDKGPRHPGLPE